jgi:2-dehydro-3-deoxygluconokinase
MAGETIVTFGEAMLRFTPPALQRIEQASAFELWVAGAELNVAVALARLGEAAAWVSRLPDNALGRRLAAHARANGVAIDAVEWAANGRLGLLFVEVGQRPRRTASLYDRDDSAFAALDPAAFDWPALLAGARAFHTSGITPALSAACARATADALAAARDAGCHTSFDLNYRALLGTPDQARAAVESLAPQIDTVIASAGETKAVFGLEGEPADVASALRDRLAVERVVVSSRVDTGHATQVRRSVCVDAEVVQAESAEFVTVDPLGGGDAFSAGFLSGLLADGPRRGLELGGAMAALKQTIPGDFAILDAGEVKELAGGNTYAGTRR